MDTDGKINKGFIIPRIVEKDGKNHVLSGLRCLGGCHENRFNCTGKRNCMVKNNQNCRN